MGFLPLRLVYNLCWKNISTQNRYKVVAVIDVVLMIVIIINGLQPARRMIAPLIPSAFAEKPLFSWFNNQTPEVFSFAPGSSSRRLNTIELEGLNHLAFFDVPVDAQGYLLTGTWGYQNYKYASADLVGKTHSYGGKFLLTFSQLGNETIRQFLDSETAQDNLINAAIEEVRTSSIDGVTLAFEFGGTPAPYYRQRFSRFVEKFSKQLHSQVPNSILAVSLGDDAIEDSLYDLRFLAQSADKIFVSGASFAGIEYKAQKNISPVFGYDSNTYWKDVSKTVSVFLKHVPLNKLAVERVWYGSGDRYPLYKPQSEAKGRRTSSIVLAPSLIERLISGVPDAAKEAARRNIPYIARALDEERILNTNVLAYALATIEHETAATFEPIDEIQGRLSARRLGYEGGSRYFGRGFIQLTHLRNYLAYGKRIGLGDELARNPQLASQPEIAARILAVFFADNNVSDLATQGNYVAARAPVNPDINAWLVARLANKYEEGFEY